MVRMCYTHIPLPQKTCIHITCHCVWCNCVCVWLGIVNENEMGCVCVCVCNILFLQNPRSCGLVQAPMQRSPMDTEQSEESSQDCATMMSPDKECRPPGTQQTTSDKCLVKVVPPDRKGGHKLQACKRKLCVEELKSPLMFLTTATWTLGILSLANKESGGRWDGNSWSQRYVHCVWSRKQRFCCGVRWTKIN